MSTNVAILGATGVVGQKVIALLQKNSSFNITELVASDRAVGTYFKDACVWRERVDPLPERIGKIILKSPKDIQSNFVISCLPSDVAENVEPMLAAKGKNVFSNASSFRMHQNVPLLVPEVNLHHLSLLNKQETKGKIITNPNCSAVGIVLALAPLMEIGRLDHVSAVTLQSISGAGYPGVPSLDILSNTIPHIESEAEKICEETRKILGTSEIHANFGITTTVHRVPVLFGHTATLHVIFDNDVKVGEVFDKYREWNCKYPNLFIIHTTKGRPQSIKDLKDDDMSLHVGHIEQGDRKNILKLVVLSHNLIRGAAGAVISNMVAYANLTK